MPINRFSSRRHRLYDAFLGDRLKGAASFIGSANDAEHAWSKNCELVWEDDTPESIESAILTLGSSFGALFRFDFRDQ